MGRNITEILPGLYLTDTNLIQTQFEFDLLSPGKGGFFEKSPPLTPQKTFDENTAQPAPDDQGSTENDEYSIHQFRALSAVIVRGKGYPIDYTKPGVLEKAASLFKGTLLNSHCRHINCWVGLVKNPVYDKTSTPPGVNVEFWLDKELDDPDQKKLIRGVQTGAINRCSAGLLFQWSKSHPKMADRVFWESLGEEIDGSEVRIIVEKIVQVFEVSLVFWGADETATALEATEGGGDPGLLATEGTENTETNASGGQGAFLKNRPLHPQKTFDENEAQPAQNKANQYQEKNKMKTLLEFMGSIAQKVGLTFETEIEFQQWVENLVQEKTKLEKRVTELLKHEEFHNNIVTAQRQECHRLAAAAHIGQEVPQMQKDLIDKADYEALKTYAAEYLKQAESNHPLKCQQCGSTNVERRSSMDVKNYNPDPVIKAKPVREVNFI